MKALLSKAVGGPETLVLEEVPSPVAKPGFAVVEVKAIGVNFPDVLIIEDDEGLQRQLKWAYDDYQVVVVGDRAAALEMLRAHEPAVVTLDLGLPPDPDGTSEGFAALSEILAVKPDAKVVVASGHGAHESALRAIALGAYDFYRKPIDIDDLGLAEQVVPELVRLPDCGVAPISAQDQGAPAVGDRIALGISHPCTTFDKWRWIPVVDDAWNLVDAIETRF